MCSRCCSSAAPAADTQQCESPAPTAGADRVIQSGSVPELMPLDIDTSWQARSSAFNYVSNEKRAEHDAKDDKDDEEVEALAGKQLIERAEREIDSWEAVAVGLHRIITAGYLLGNASVFGFFLLPLLYRLVFHSRRTYLNDFLEA